MKRPKPDEPLQVIAQFETIANNQLAADLFGTMLRSVEMARERLAEGKNNDRAHHGTDRRSRIFTGEHK